MTKSQIPTMTIKDLQELFNVDRTTIYEWRRAGLPYYKLGGSVRFKEEEVLEWIERQKVTE